MPALAPDLLFQVEAVDPCGQVLPDFVKAEPAAPHFINGFGLRPSLHDNPVEGAHGAGAIGTVLAVDENGSIVRVGTRSAGIR